MAIVPPSGPVDSPFVIIGEAPGIQELKQGAPFVGPSGMVLRAALDQFPKDEYPEPYILNVVPHGISSADKDAALLSKLCTQYAPAALELIDAHPRKVILALGNVALWAMTNDHSHKITQKRGILFPSKHAEMGVLAATHPAFLLRGGGSFRQFKSDVAYAINLARGGAPHEFTPPTWEVLTTEAEIKDLVGLVHSHTGIVTGDIETSGFSHLDDHILCAGFTLTGKHVYVIPGRKTDIDPAHNMIGALGKYGFWNAPNVRWNWHNGKFDIKFFHTIGQIGARVDEDTMLLSYSLDETRGIHDLEQVASDWLGSPRWKDILDAHKKKNQSYDVIPKDVLIKYMAYDVRNTHCLHPVLYDILLKDKKSTTLYTKTLIPASAYLAEIEECGMLIDMQRVQENYERLDTEANKYKAELSAIAEAIRPGFYTDKMCNSPKQLDHLLFMDLKLQSKDKSRGTSVDVLEKLPQVPAVVALQKYRKIHKGLSTYVKPVEEARSKVDGRIHSSYLLHGTATGRLASRDPNLQNIPRDPAIRGQFIPRPGYCYIEVDLNQAELRSLAILSGDEALCRVYDPSVNSPGLHEEVRHDIYGNADSWTPEQLRKYIDKWYIREDDIKAATKRVLEEQKMRAKNVNFGIVYGITPFGLSEQIEDTPQEAARMLAAWAKKFPKAWLFIEMCRKAPIQGKNLVTVFGHKKRFGIVSPENYINIQNEAANFPHQSTASTVTIHGGMRVQRELRDKWDTMIVNTVHDSIILETPMVKDMILGASNLAKRELEQVPIDWGLTRIPFKADAKAGLRWGSMEGLDSFFKSQGLQ